MAEEAPKTSELKKRLQHQLDEAKQRLDNARQDIADLHEADKAALRAKATEVQERIDAQKQRAQQLQQQVSSWMAEKKQHSDEAIASWREKRQIKHLEKRADRAEEYAVNAVIVAMMDADDAELAVLDALDARLDVEEAAAK